jgi:hypothetical protein
MAQAQILLQFVPANGEIAIFQAQFFPHRVAPRGQKGQGTGHRVQNHQLSGINFQRARGQPRIFRTRWPLTHHYPNLHHRFQTQLLRHRVGIWSAIRVTDNLHPPGVIPQVEKNHTPVIPVVLHPAAQLHHLPYLTGGKLAT